MYESYWRLKQKPFENAADPRFYYPAESHQAALLKLRYAIENRRGGALLAGVSGSGKTLLVNMMRTMLGDDFGPFIHLVFPQMPTADLMAYLAEEFDGPGGPASAAGVQESVRRIGRALTTMAGQEDIAPVLFGEAGRPTVLGAATLAVLGLQADEETGEVVPAVLRMSGAVLDDNMTGEGKIPS